MIGFKDRHSLGERRQDAGDLARPAARQHQQDRGVWRHAKLAPQPIAVSLREVERQG